MIYRLNSNRYPIRYGLTDFNHTYVMIFISSQRINRLILIFYEEKQFKVSLNFEIKPFNNHTVCCKDYIFKGM